MREETTVGIIGAGPAGLLLANLLLQDGVACVVLEHRTRHHVEHRARAGAFEDRIVRMLDKRGLASGLSSQSIYHGGCEFRLDGQRFRVPYADLTGKAHYIYPQQSLVRDLIASFLDSGGQIRFNTTAQQVENHMDQALVIYRDETTGKLNELRCEFLAGCDGFWGVSRKSLPPEIVRTYHRQHKWGWLAILAATPPSNKEVTCGLHPDGLAAHMLRTAEITRFYLQYTAGDHMENWPPERIWSELEKRLALNEPWTLTRGELIEIDMVDMRSHVVAPMQHDRIFLAGDAAHILPPVVPKGANLALADAAFLAKGMVQSLKNNDDKALLAYSQTRLADVWQTQAFSSWVLELVCSQTDGDPFTRQIQRSWMHMLHESSPAAHWFATHYVDGVGGV
jgi:p-hydroxybenzoate 3-monooxygenase